MRGRFRTVFVRDRPLVRSRGRVVLLGHLRAFALFEYQLLLGQMVLVEDAVQSPDLVEINQPDRVVVTEVTHQSPDVGPVLLLDVRAVVAVLRPGPRESDLLVEAVLVDVVVDKFRAVAQVDLDDRIGKHLHYVVQGFEHPPRCLVFQAPVHRPPGRGISDGQGETEFAGRIATLMTDQLNLHIPRHSIPSSQGSDRDLRLHHTGAGALPALEGRFNLARISW